MNSLYLDTNIFLYLSDKSSPYYLSCFKFIKFCKKEKILLLTSTETIQEIIHYSKNVKQVKEGLEAAKQTLQLLSGLLPIDQSIIEIYLKYVSIYKNASSRDLIHLAVCLENKINKIVTFDKDFKKFKEITLLQPQDIGN
ncbi:type II toxin-antitoxin system VapC family toxin [Candidatus Daviesbacteria bacterium]|nr:type II toxin-antitoxin system VapC family toxin [Candidatus Daviesbacteria bacterium]